MRTDANPVVYLLPGIGGDLQQVVALSTLALALLWDPDESMLDDASD